MNNDLIRRSELKKAFDDYSKTNPNLSGIFEVGKFIIDNAPTVIPDIEEFDKALHKWFEDIDEWEKKNGKIRPQGEWKYICSYANTHLMRYGCSKCGRTVDVYKRQELLVKYPFCHCGAEMRKSGQEVSNDN